VPRPESFCDDVNTAQDMVEADQEKGDDNGAPTTLFEARKSLWRNLASAAESGWDFSCEPF
jgi:neutral trehalase